MNGIYKCTTEDGQIAYVGSSGISLSKLEYNHRNYFKYKNGYESLFRKNLRAKGKNWIFEWVVEPYSCSKKEIETREGDLINKLRPLYNVDRDPVQSSIKYGRYN